MENNIGVGHFETTPEMRAAVNDVLDTGRLSYGPYSRRLEKEFAAMHGCNFGVLSNSGTSSLQVALQALKEIHDWGPGDEVIVPAVTFVATANVVIHNRLRPVLVDVDPYTYNIDVSKIEAAITPHTKAIIPVHLFGQPANMIGIMEIARRHNLKVIEDSCECVLGRINERTVGAWGDIACFSTYVAHVMTTGVGGIATTNDRRYAEVMRSLVNHGRDGIYISVDDDDNLSGKILNEVMTRRFNFERIGHSFRITELEAALGVAQLPMLADNIMKRQANADALTGTLEKYKLGKRVQPPTWPTHHAHSFMMYPLVVLSPEPDKWGLAQFLEELGIETREMLPLTNQPCYRSWSAFTESRFPVADWINKRGIYVGCHPGLGEDAMVYIGESIREYFDGR